MGFLQNRQQQKLQSATAFIAKVLDLVQIGDHDISEHTLVRMTMKKLNPEAYHHISMMPTSITTWKKLSEWSANYSKIEQQRSEFHHFNSPQRVDQHSKRSVNALQPLMRNDTTLSSTSIGKIDLQNSLILRNQ